MKETNIFDALDNVLGNYMEGKATREDVVNIAWKANTYLKEHTHPHDVIKNNTGLDDVVSVKDAELYEAGLDAIKQALTTPIIIGRLESLARYDAEIEGGCDCCGYWVELGKCSSGGLVKWEDIEKLIEGLKTDNAL